MLPVETKTRGVTVSAVEPLIEPAVALIVVVPVSMAAAAPRFPASLLIAATAVLDELQVADCKICVLPSVNVPVATNCWVVPTEIDGVVGLSTIETSPVGARVIG